MTNKILKIFFPFSVLFPLIASAQLSGVTTLIIETGVLVRSSIILVGGLALLAFLWGLTKFIFKLGGSEDSVEEGKRLMKWGLVALFVMVAVWGIVNFMIAQVLNGVSTTPPPLPFPTP